MAKMESGLTTSKKFIAIMMFSITWLISIWIAINADLDKDIILSMVNFAGFCQVMYIGGQSAIDTIVRKAWAGAVTQGNRKNV